MSPLEVLQLIGYGLGAALPLWMGALLLRRRSGLGKIESVLLALGAGIGLWHASNLIVTLHGILGLDRERWAIILRLADTAAVISITLSYSFLLHAHVHLWARARRRALTIMERVRVYLSYFPAIFLSIAIPLVWRGEYAPMFEKLSFFVLPFSLWAAYVLGLVAATDLLISRIVSSEIERRIMQAIAGSFLAIGVLILAALAFGFGRGTTPGLYLQTLANLGSLLPTALIAYYIYRYRYLELIIRESFIVASFAVVVLALYLYVIRTLGASLTTRYNLRAGAIEALLILALALFAVPLRGWLEGRFHKLFAREATLYREVVARIGERAGQYKQLPDLLRFVEERTAQSLKLRRVCIITSEADRAASDNVRERNDNLDNDVSADDRKLKEQGVWVKQLLEVARARDWQAVEGEQILREHGYEIAYALRREDRMVGLMFVDAAIDALTDDTRAVLGVLAGQVAVAIEDCRLVEENVRLERRLAQGERLAALGQMAATVAHEVKNPLSAIKSIAQVMREDERLSGEYARDLSLIVGETDRLSRSVTQLLNFARHAPPAAAPSRADEIVRATAALFRAEADGRGIALECSAEVSHELDGVRASAVRDALSNLLLNALQATPAGGRITIEARRENDGLLIRVTDSGPGIAAELRERIWEPFFTTKQRGTGLGLAIVRKRMEEAGGTARLAPTQNGEGARFELHTPPGEQTDVR